MSVEGEIVSGKVWDDFCDSLKRAGSQILRHEAPATVLDRAEGWRYLTRLLRLGLAMHVEFADPDYPGFFAPSHETLKVGADNPDNLYQMARISGHHEYVIRGHRGTVPYLSFGTQRGGYETDGRMIQTGFLDGADLKCARDGSFEVVLSQQPRESNWLKLEPASNAVIVRQTFLDRKQEKAASLSIQRLGEIPPPAPLTPERLVDGLTRAADFVEGTARLFANWAEGFQERPNKLPPADQAVCQKVGGDPNIFYYHSYWELGPGEVLVVHLPRMADCRFWNLQVNNYWMESLDYRYHRISVNSHTVKRDPDGSVTVVVAHRDPGHPNWLETAGHSSGTLCMRWVGAKEPVHPGTRVVKQHEVAALGPGSFARKVEYFYGGD